MKTVKIGEKEIGLKATPLALLYYKQEFKTDLIGDLVKMSSLGNDLSNLDTIAILQLVWAMHKADNGVGKAFPEFEKWLADLNGLDFTDPDFINAVIAEAEDGFFRGAKSRAAVNK